MNARILTVLSAVVVLSACTPSVDDLMEDPELFQKVGQKCMFASAKGKPETQECKNFEEAQKKMTNHLMKQVFGEAGH